MGVTSYIEVWDIAAARARSILTLPFRVEAPNWHPDGRSLMVNSDGALYHVPLDKPRLELIDTGGVGRLNNDHGFSPDGSQIIFSAHRGNGAEMFLMPARGGPPQLISPAAPSWFHGWHGDWLVYPAVRGQGPLDIYRMPAGGGAEQRLTGRQGHADGPDFAADGSRIYFNSDRGGHAQIWVMAADGGGQRQLWADANVNWFPHPSPCGRWLIWLAYPPLTQGHPADVPVQIGIGTPAGENRQMLTGFIGGQGTMNVPNWAPDGSAFAYIRYG